MNGSGKSVYLPQIGDVDAGTLERVHESSLGILQQTGVNVHHPQLRALLAEAGATVTGDLTMHLPAGLVEKALATAPSRIDVYDRQGTVAMRLEGTNVYFGTGSDLHYSLERGGTRRRPSVLEDVAEAAELCDKLEHMDFVMSYALPSDAPGDDCEARQLEAMMAHTRKPVIMTAFSGQAGLESLHEVACSFMASGTTFRAVPNYVLYSQFVSPLQHDRVSLERLIYCAEQGIPLIYVPTIMMGASGPVTLAGVLALANAECLAGLVMHQLYRPGAPFIYGGCVSPLDMQTTVFAYGTPEWRLADVVLSKLSQRYRLPVFGTGGATDAKAIDVQAGAEWAFSLLTAALAGTNLIHDVAYLESGLTGSLEALVICDEIVGMVKRLLAGLMVTDETLALKLIDEVGPAGHFVDSDHTLTHFKKAVWYPRLFDRQRHDAWQASGEDLVNRAAKRVEELKGARPAKSHS